MTSSNRWKASKDAESRKLASSDGWTFDGNSSMSSSPFLTAGSSSRGKRVNIEFVDGSLLPASSPIKRTRLTDEEVVLSTVGDSSSISSSRSTRPKPPATRVLLEKKMIGDMMERHMKCPKCSEPVAICFPTVCIASGCRIDCSNTMCDFVEMERPHTATLPVTDDMGSPFIVRNTDYQVNIAYVLAFMASGDGGKEAERVLGFLGLPNSTTMEKRSFTGIEERISPLIHELNEEILSKNLSDAVEKHYDGCRLGDKLLFDLWKEQLKLNKDDEPVLPPEHYPCLTASADMAWQKRSSGNRYDSNSGFAVLVDGDTRYPIAVDIKSKICSVCKANSNDEQDFDVRPHKCTINHTGSSGAMEPRAILDMVVGLYDHKSVCICRLVTDDDSSIKAKLKWSNEDHMTNNNTTETPTIVNRNGRTVNRPNHGELPSRIPELTFVADPNHRKKTLKGELYKQLKKRKPQRCGLTRVDIMRVSTNFAYMVRTLPGKTPEEMLFASNAVVNHHFDDHTYCGAFCKRKTLSDEEKQQSTKIYRSKEKDAKLYGFLINCVARFITPDAIREVGHGMDTQVNESLNNTVAWLAPKNKTYSGTCSLSNQICLALGVHSVGTDEYYERLFAKLSIQLAPDVRHYFAQQQKARAYRIAHFKKTAIKKKRNYKLHDKLREYSEGVKKEIAKRDGCTYQPGIGMDGGYVAIEDAVAPPHDTNIRCSACGEAGHKMRTNKKCRFYRSIRGASATKPAAIIDEDRDAVEQDLMDEVGFEESDDEFFDTIEDEEDFIDTSFLL